MGILASLGEVANGYEAGQHSAPGENAAAGVGTDCPGAEETAVIQGGDNTPAAIG
jgi:hypothetical protein